MRYALARAEREAAAGRGRLDPIKPEGPAVPWRRLGRLDERLRPLQLLGEGRTWLVQVDGAVVAEHARNCLGGLAFWIQDQLRRQQASRDSRDTSEFVFWWAREVQRHVFRDEPVGRSEDISDLSLIEGSIHSSGLRLDRLEEHWVEHWARS